jgi:hypothetical protein
MSLEFYCRWSSTVAIPCLMAMAVTRWIKLCPLDGANGSVSDENFAISSKDTERKGTVTSVAFFSMFFS